MSANSISVHLIHVLNIFLTHPSPCRHRTARFEGLLHWYVESEFRPLRIWNRQTLAPHARKVQTEGISQKVSGVSSRRRYSTHLQRTPVQDTARRLPHPASIFLFVCRNGQCFLVYRLQRRSCCLTELTVNTVYTVAGTK